MSESLPDSRRRIVFVAPRFAGEALLAAQAITKLADVKLLGVHQDGPLNREVFTETVSVQDVHDVTKLLEAAQRLSNKWGALTSVVTVHETLLLPVAHVNESLALGGMKPSTVKRVLDKSLLKSALAIAGVETSRDCVVTDVQLARDFANENGFPVVLKPLAGSGGLATWCVESAEQLELALDLLDPSPDSALFMESHLVGQELCIDTITVANEPQIHSVCRYRPTILHALQNPTTQWTCIMPRDADLNEYRDFVHQGLTAVRALGVGSCVTHMEGFLLPDGRVRFTDATLRPAGARIGPMLGFACDIDPHLAWARVAVDGVFDGPWKRKYAVGTIFLRGHGSGEIAGVDGWSALERSLGDQVVDSHYPQVGSPKSVTYTGDGYITLRHPETQVVEQSMRLIEESVAITYTNTETAGSNGPFSQSQWSERLQHFQQARYRPVWE